LQSHAMSVSALQQVFRAVVISKLTCAYPAWWAFTKSSNRQRIDAVLRRTNKSGFWTSAVPSDFLTFEDLCSTADDELFTKTSTFSNHILHAFLPPHHSDSVHTPFSSLDTPPVFLIVISLPVCYIKPAY